MLRNENTGNDNVISHVSVKNLFCTGNDVPYTFYFYAPLFTTYNMFWAVILLYLDLKFISVMF